MKDVGIAEHNADARVPRELQKNVAEFRRRAFDLQLTCVPGVRPRIRIEIVGPVDDDEVESRTDEFLGMCADDHRIVGFVEAARRRAPGHALRECFLSDRHSYATLRSRYRSIAQRPGLA